MRQRLLRFRGIVSLAILVPCVAGGAPADTGGREALALRAARFLARVVFDEQDLTRQLRAESYGLDGNVSEDTRESAVDPAAVAAHLAALLAAPAPNLSAISEEIAEAERRLGKPGPPPAGKAIAGAESAYALAVQPEGRWAVDDAALAAVWTALNATAAVVEPEQADGGLDRVVEIDIPTWAPPGTSAPPWLDPGGAAVLAERVALDYGPRLEGAGVILLRDSRPPFEDLLGDVPAWEEAMHRAARETFEGNLAEFAARYGVDITSWDAWRPGDVVKTGHPRGLRADLLSWTRRLYAEHRQALIGAVREARPGASVRAAWDASRAWAGPPRAIWENPFATLSGMKPDGWVIRYGDRNPDLLPATFWNIGFTGRPAVLWEELRARDEGAHPLGPAYRHHGVLVHVRARAESLLRLAALGAQRRWIEGLDPRAYRSLPRIPDIAVMLCLRGLEEDPGPVRLWDKVAAAQEQVRLLGYDGSLLPIEIARTRAPAIFALRCIWVADAENLDAQAEGPLVQWVESGGVLLADGPLGASATAPTPEEGRKRLLEAIGVYRSGEGWMAAEGGATDLHVLERDDEDRPLLVEAKIGSGVVLVPLVSGSDPLPSFRRRAAELAADKLSPTPARPIPGPGGTEPVLVVVVPPRGDSSFLWLGNASARPLLGSWSSPLTWEAIRELQGPERSVELLPPEPKRVFLRPWEAAVFELEAGKTR